MADANIDESAPLIFHASRVLPKTDNRTQFQKRLAVWLILFAVALERFAFYSLAGNLVLFLTSDAIQWTSLHSVTASFIFFGKIIKLILFDLHELSCI
jgi:dipeptide/tripeptide permease